MMQVNGENVPASERPLHRSRPAARAPRRLLIAALAVLCAAAAGAQPVSLTVSTTSSVFLGGVTEVVLDQGYKVSELDWPLLPVITIGTTLDLTTEAGFRAVLVVQKGFPMYDGTMTDSDFLNGDGVKTHFSQSNSFSEGITVLDVRLGWSFGLGAEGERRSSLFPFLSFQYLQLKWSARDGYLQYPPETSAPFTPWSPSEPQVPIYGIGITYEQDYYIPAVGLEASFPLASTLRLTASFAISPYLWLNDIDDHIFRLLLFYTNMKAGFFLEPRVALAWQVTPKVGLSLDALYRHISQVVGDSYAVAQGASGFTSSPSGLMPGQQTLPVTNGGGATLDAVSIVLSVNLSL